MSVIDKIKERKARAQQSSRPETATELNQRVADIMKPPPAPTREQQCDYIQKTLGTQRKAELVGYLKAKGLNRTQMADMSAKTVLEHNADFISDRNKYKLSLGNPVNQIAKLLRGS